MQLNNRICIYENNTRLREAIYTLATNCGAISKDIIFINILFNDDGAAAPLHSAISTVLKLENEQQSPVLLYGYESIEGIRRRADNILFDNPLVKYIQMPFAFSEFNVLVRTLNELAISSVNQFEYKLESFLELEQAEAIKTLRILRHDILNAIRNLESVYLLTWDVNDQDKAQNRRSVEQTIRLAKESISSIEKEFQLNSTKLKDVLSSEAFAAIIANLGESDIRFNRFRSTLHVSSDMNIDNTIKMAEEIIQLLSETSAILGEAFHGRSSEKL